MVDQPIKATNPDDMPFDYNAPEDLTRLVMMAHGHPDEPVETGFLFWSVTPAQDQNAVKAIWAEAQENHRKYPGVTWMPTNV